MRQSSACPPQPAGPTEPFRTTIAAGAGTSSSQAQFAVSQYPLRCGV
ncbi:MAG: hypothetical protein KME26_15240 [Oscillatoria princeps RMCB-10]|nr:hypothetical protein [Oscillatoria princeps RMCB-10]